MEPAMGGELIRMTDRSLHAADADGRQSERNGKHMKVHHSRLIRTEKHHTETPRVVPRQLRACQFPPPPLDFGWYVQLLRFIPHIYIEALEH